MDEPPVLTGSQIRHAAEALHELRRQTDPFMPEFSELTPQQRVACYREVIAVVLAVQGYLKPLE